MIHRFATAIWSSALEPGENRDAAAVRLACDHTQPVAHLAVADGASRTLFSGQWARTLVEAAVEDWPSLGSSDLLAQVDELRASFDPLTQNAVTDPAVEDKWMDHGSQATLVTATVTGDHGGGLDVSALAVGDSVLLVLGHAGRTSVFPPMTSADFGPSPRLVTSRVGEQVEAVRWNGRISDRDLLVLASDGAARVLTAVIERDGTEEGWRRLARLVERGCHHGILHADLAGALLGDASLSFQDDATLLVCAMVPDIAALSDIQLLARFMSGTDTPPSGTGAGLLHRLLRLRGLLSGWRSR